MKTNDDLIDLAREALGKLGADEELFVPDSALGARSPLSGQQLFGVRQTTPDEAGEAIGRARDAFTQWRLTPAPVRGKLVKRLGELISENAETLATLVTIEAGKIRSEALGEVQEMIDVCDLAVGLSRQLYGKTMPSERPGHRLQETWHPLGVVGVISAFNFPVAVWSWNTAVALVCGDTVVWKPSELTSLCAIGCHTLLRRAARDVGAPEDVHQLVLGAREVGEIVVDDPRVALVSATGSTRMGREVGPRVAARFGRSLLELGGNNAVIMTPSADKDQAVNSIVFAAAGTAGQRCTSMRRLIVHESIADEVVAKIAAAFHTLPIGDPFESGTLVGPLVHEDAFETMQKALGRVGEIGGEVVTGGERVDTGMGGAWVRPALVRVPKQEGIMLTETFAPILYVVTYADFDEALALHNAVPQGLSSGIFTTDQTEAERYLSAEGADTGIANVNAGTSGAEIGGAFGGEKETGGGRESGSDAWRSYMRRATNTINYSGRVELAQGVNFSA
ncbi:L-piperidine-6-carboxylate dehydrogenase [Nigerium massiliense]|uniref:L-piperidine-6-carboxylate dehydrogenase n=1 Tax=Nigerium massiliense TaxID=1522317 RepID=UPI00058E2937|nr:aldehyde dehydrogenase family protein [Nigerium massiliense]